MKPRGKKVKWSPKIAYAIGLLTTDGNLSIDGRHIEFTSKDKALVSLLRKCLNLDNKIGRKNNKKGAKKKYFRIQFGNVVFYKQLLKIGLVPNKSERIEELKKIPNQYFFDFLRGHLDGDGSISRYQDPIYPNSKRFFIRFRSASLKHIQWLQAKIKSLLKIKGSIIKEKSINIFSLQFAKRESLILLPYLYSMKEILYLPRKYKIIEDLLNN